MEKKIKIFGKAEPGALEQAERCAEKAAHIVLMADNHKGFGMPIGGVALYKDSIPPAGVGFDIGCGNKAVKLNIKYSDIVDQEKLADAIWDTISFGTGQKNNVIVEHELFDDPLWGELDVLSDSLKKKAQAQLGTVGAGNHYVDVLYDEDGYVWIGAHFGSRGFGHTIASHYMKIAGDNLRIINEAPSLLPADSKEGQEYIKAMELAGRYAYAGRDWVCERIAEIIGAEISETVHNHHNFAWREEHNGEDYWVVRKGATPAFPGQHSFVGSSMGDTSVVVEGIESEASKEAFYSTVHGAGRIMSRTQALGKRKKIKGYHCRRRDCDGVLLTQKLTPEEASKGNPLCPICGHKTKWYTKWEKEPGEIDFEKTKERLKERKISLRGGGPDEAPGVYKDLNEVLKYHKDTIKVLHTLTPFIVCMAGPENRDPYKD